MAAGAPRAGDLLGRFGGEEFLFVFRADRQQAGSILKRIQFDLRKAFFGVLALPVTFSAGAASREGALPRLGRPGERGGPPAAPGESRGQEPDRSGVRNPPARPCMCPGLML